MYFLRDVELSDKMDQYGMTPEQVHQAIIERKADAIYAIKCERNQLC